MEASDTDVIKSLGSVTEKLESDEGFFGHGMIGGPCGADGDVERNRRGSAVVRGGERESAGGGVIFCLGKEAAKGASFGRFDAGDEHRLFLGMKTPNNRGDLRYGFACPINNFWGSEATLALQIELGKSAGQKSAGGATVRHQVLGEGRLQPGKKLGDGESFLLHGVAMAKGDGIFLACEGSVFSPFEGLEIDGDPERSPNLVLATIAAADGA